MPVFGHQFHNHHHNDNHSLSSSASWRKCLVTNRSMNGHVWASVCHTGSSLSLVFTITIIIIIRIVLVIFAKNIIIIPHHSTHVLKIWPSHEMPEVETPLLAINRHKIQGKGTNSEGSGVDQMKIQIQIQIQICTNKSHHKIQGKAGHQFKRKWTSPEHFTENQIGNCFCLDILKNPWNWKWGPWLLIIGLLVGLERLESGSEQGRGREGVY